MSSWGEVSRVKSHRRTTWLFLAAAGLNHPAEILPRDFYIRLAGPATMSADRSGIWLQPGSLLDGGAPEDYRDYWAMAKADSFRALG